MLLVPVYLAASPVHGIGVFAKQAIASGARVWEFSEGFDRKFTQEEFIKSPLMVQDWIKKYGYFDDEKKDFWYAPFGEAAFINHSSRPNLIPGPLGEHCDYAACEIAENEELLTNYSGYYMPNEHQPWLRHLQP